MRQEVIDKIKQLNVSNIDTSSELPFDESGTPLYLKNPRRFYVDRTQFDSSPIIQTLGGKNISNTTTSVTVYFAVDAKNSPVNLEEVVNSLRGLEDTIELEGAHTRECTIVSDYVGDLLEYTVEYRLTRIN